MTASSSSSSSDASRAVWVAGADPNIVSADDILDLAKIVGDVESVKLQYHAESKSVIYRIVFKLSMAAEAILSLEGLQFKDCILRFSSSVFGSRPAVVPQSEKTITGTSAQSQPPAMSVDHTTKSSVLPYHHLMPADYRLDAALLPIFETLRGVALHWEDAAANPLPSSLSNDELDYLRQNNMGPEALIPLITQFYAMHEVVGKANEDLIALQQLKQEKEEEMASLLKRQQQEGGGGSKATKNGAFETRGEAETLKPRRIRNQVPLSSNISHPQTLLQALIHVAGPIADFEVQYVGHYGQYGNIGGVGNEAFSFHICVDFVVESSAQTALSVLQGGLADLKRRQNAAGKRAGGQVVNSDELDDDISQLSLLRFASWENAAFQFQRPCLEVKVSDEVVQRWNELLKATTSLA